MLIRNCENKFLKYVNNLISETMCVVAYFPIFLLEYSLFPMCIYYIMTKNQVIVSK